MRNSKPISTRVRANSTHAPLEGELALAIDVTFPAPAPVTGSLHPIRRAMEDACGYFERHGFAVVLGPEVETDYYNFDALNIPADHPARESLDSFYLHPGVLLRTHTSPMQVRTMQAHPAPLAIVVPAKHIVAMRSTRATHRCSIKSKGCS